MPGLLDVARISKQVTVEGADEPVPVYGVSAKGIAVLLDRFPILRELFAGRQIDMTPDKIIALVPDAIACIIACGMGFPGDAAQEAAAAQLPAETQLDFISQILALTMPKGVGPFVEKIGALLPGEAGILMSTPDMKSPQPSSP